MAVPQAESESSIFPFKDPVDVIATHAGGVGRRTGLGSVGQPDGG
jgi:hypothetical protein